MEMKLAKITQKVTIRIMQGIHWFYLQQKKRQLKELWHLPLRVCVVCAGILTLFVYTLDYGNKSLIASPEFFIIREQLIIKNVAPWLENYTEKISPLGLPTRISIFDPALPQCVADSYLRNPWVKRVVEVERSYPNHVAVKLILRKPVVYLKRADFFYISDADMVRLPGQYQQQDLPEKNLLVITGTTGQVPEPGNSWQDPDLLQAIRIAEMVNTSGVNREIPICTIHLKKQEDSLRNEIVLETIHETKIIWGRKFTSLLPPVSPQQRMDALTHLLKHPDLIENPQLQGIDTVDIRFGFAIVREEDNT